MQKIQAIVLGVLPAIVVGILSTQAQASKLVTKITFSTQYTRVCRPLGLTPRQFKELPRRRSYGLKPVTYKRLVRAQELYGNEKYVEAFAILNPLLKRVKSKPYEYATVLNTMAYVYASKEDYKKAISLINEAINLNVLPYRREQTMLIRVASLFMATGDYKKAEQFAVRYFKHAVNPNSNRYELLGVAYARLNKIRQSICPIYDALKNWYSEQDLRRAAVAKAKDEGKPPPKILPEAHPKATWYALLLAQHWQLKDYKGAVAIAEEGIHHYPGNKRFWTVLRGAPQSANNYLGAAAAGSVGERAKVLNRDGDLRNLASNYAYLEIPYKAAETLERGLRSGAIKPEAKRWAAVAGNWAQARERARAVKAYERAAKLDDGGRYYLREGDTYTAMEKWSSAVKSYRDALKKGKLTDHEKGRAYLNMGVARFNMNQFDAALNAFEKAGRFKKYKRQSIQWRRYAMQKRSEKESQDLVNQG